MGEEKGLVSVVIPMYNSENTIVETIEAVLHQTRVDAIKEVLVVNDGSDDNSPILIRKKFGNETIVHLVDKKNGGVSTARNEGIRRATGEWIALLDSDDVWTKDKIEKQLQAVEKHPEIQFIGANRNDELLTWGTKIDEGLYYLDLRHILIKNWPHTSTALIKKSVLDDVGLFNEKQRYAEDGELWNRIAYKYGLYYLYDSLEVAGGNKLSFGISGLSANLKGMYLGNVSNIRYLRTRHMISAFFYFELRVYYYLKYIRRIIISKRARKKNNAEKENCCLYK